MAFEYNNHRSRDASRVAARKSCTALGQVNYQDSLDVRKDIAPTPGRYGESAPGT